MSINNRLEAVYPNHDLVTYSKLSKSIMSECPECEEKKMEVQHQYYPNPDSWVECMACGSEFDFKTETSMWIKKREESKGN